MATPSTPAAVSSVSDVAEEAHPRWRSAYIATSAAVAFLALVAWSFIDAPDANGTSLVFLLTLGLAAVVGARSATRLPGMASLAISGDIAPLIAAAVVAPSLAVAVAVLAAIGAPAATWSVKLLNGAQIVLATAAASGVAVVVGMPDVTGSTFVSGVLAVAFTFVTVNVALVALYEMVVWKTQPQSLIGSMVASSVATTVIMVPLVTMLAWTIDLLGPAASPLLFLPLVATQYFHGLYHRKVQLTDELAEKAQVLARTNLQFAAAMVKALDARDAYTAGHSAAVAVYTRDIAREMGFDDETVRMAHLSGLLHDIGKIGVPGRVLNKTAPLDDEEYELMKSHAAMGASILGEVDLYEDIAVLVRYHHERIDGRGYPDGISGEAIPAISRMISVADTYSAMTTDRPYRDGMPTEKAMSILRECRGTQLDKDFTDAFLRILIVADEAYQRGKQTEFEVEVAKHQALSEVEAEAVRIQAPVPAGPEPVEPVIPAAVDGELVEVELEREAA